MSALERIGTTLMLDKKAALSVRSDGVLIMVVHGFDAVRMTIAEAKAWREGLSRAIRQAESVEASK